MRHKSDRALGMGRDITRRDFLHGAGLATLALTLPPGAGASSDPRSTGRTYPPTRTGLRGSHKGSFEVAHDLALGGSPFSGARDLDEQYDLVVVGAGISGLAAAHFYRQQHGGDARILLLDNHDDFGGHAKRNEFHQAGAMCLALGGTHNLEYPYFSDTVHALLDELGVDLDTLKTQTGFDYGARGANGRAVWFDADSFGGDRLVTGLSFRSTVGGDYAERIDACPLAEDTRQALKAFYARRSNVFEGRSQAEVDRLLRRTSYPDFLRTYGGLNDEALRVMRGVMHGYWGLSLEALSARECLDQGMPGRNLLGGENPAPAQYRVAMFPDGNASIARLLVHSLIPAVAPGAGPGNIAVADFDYAQLDRARNPVRLRLNSTVVRVQNRADGCETQYVHGGETFSARARHCILACYHEIIPHLCPELPEAQKTAQKYQVKRPLLLTNVLIRDRAPLEALGISGAYCPGRLHTWLYEMRGNTGGGFDGNTGAGDATVMMFWGLPAPPEGPLTATEQVLASRKRMLELDFEDYEREVRTVLDRLLGPTGFEVREDVLAITVNRWPHGYGHDYLDLWDPEFAPGEAPHEIARRPFGAIAIANTDAGADAYTHVAIDQAWRAVTELVAARG